MVDFGIGCAYTGIMPNKIIDRIRKLLAASHSDNEHEAALAAQRAADLMTEYHLTEAELRLENNAKKAEPILEAVTIEGKLQKKRVAWKELIADGVAKSLGCHLYLGKFGPTVMGRESACAAWSYTCQYLFNEVERLAEEAWLEECVVAAIAGHTRRKWKNSFRVGCAQSIIMRLYEGVEQKAPADPSQKALMVLKDDEKEVENVYQNMSAEWGKASMIGLVSNRTGYKAGLEVGADLELNQAKGALKEGQPVLT